MFKLTPLNALGAILASLLSGAAAGWGVELAGGIFIIIFALILGPLAGEIILRASGRKRGIKMELIAGIGMIIGAIGARLIVAWIYLSQPGHSMPTYGIYHTLIDLVSPTPFPLIALILIIFLAVSRIRYI